MGVKTTTIRVYPKTKDRLDLAGRKGMSYDSIINNVLDAIEERGTK